MKKVILKSVFATLFTLFFIVGCSTSSDSNGNSTTTVVPVAPSNLIGTVVSTTQINLSWTDNSTNETGFKIERKTASGMYAVVGTTVTNITTFNDTGLTPSTTYTYRVYSNNLVGNSLTYSNELTLTITGADITVTDIDGNTYQTVTICSQVWTKTNLNVSRYRNGDIIPQVTDPTAWKNMTTGAWCYYNNATSNGGTYGKLYNWYAVRDSRGLAPIGWHIATAVEWTNLTDCLGGIAVAGGKMKETGITHWKNPNTDATNSSGFTGLPGGCRLTANGTDFIFSFVGYQGFYWSSSEYSTTSAWYCSVHYYFGSTTSPYDTKSNGFSIRCLRD